MVSARDLKLLREMDKFASVNVLRARHARRVRRTMWIVGGALASWGAAALWIVVGTVPPDFEPVHESILPWYEQYFMASEGLLHTPFVVGQVHVAQTLLLVVAAVTIFRTARAHARLPQKINDAQAARAQLSEAELRALFGDKVQVNQSLDMGSGDEASSWVLGKMSAMGAFGVLLCVMAIGSMDDVFTNIWNVGRWERHIRHGVFGEVAFGMLFVGALFLIFVPMVMLYRLGQISQRRDVEEAREDMLVLQQELFHDMEGALSRAESTQGGELSLDE